MSMILFIVLVAFQLGHSIGEWPEIDASNDEVHYGANYKPKTSIGSVYLESINTNLALRLNVNQNVFVNLKYAFQNKDQKLSKEDELEVDNSYYDQEVNAEALFFNEKQKWGVGLDFKVPSFYENTLSNFLYWEYEWQNNISSLIGVSYFEFIDEFKIWHREFPVQGPVDLWVTGNGIKSWFNLEYEVSESFKLSPFYQSIFSLENNVRNEYVLALDGRLNQIGLSAKIKYKTHKNKFTLEYTDVELESSGLRYNNDEVKRFHYGESDLNRYLFAYSYSSDVIKNIFLEYSFNKVTQDSTANYSQERKETLSYNRLFPASIDVILGSSWFNLLGVNSSEIGIHLIRNKMDLSILKSDLVEVDVLAKIYFANLKIDGVWYDVEEGLFRDEITPIAYDNEINILISRIRFKSLLHLSSSNEIILRLNQWIPIWMSAENEIDSSNDNESTLSDYSFGQGLELGLEYFYKF